MIITTYNGVLTDSRWWSLIRISADDPQEVVLQNKRIEDWPIDLRVAKFRSKKRATELYEAISKAIAYDAVRFDVKKWVSEYSSRESSNTSSESP